MPNQAQRAAAAAAAASVRLRSPTACWLASTSLIVAA